MRESSDFNELDRSVIDRARAGDEAARGRSRSLNPAVLRYLRSLGHEAAEDIASVVWIEVARALPNLRSSDLVALRGLVFTIARRRMVDEFRRRSRSPEVSYGEPPESARVDAVELDTAIDILRALPPVQAEIIALRVIAGMSAAEVAQITGRSAAGVRVIAHRALLALRRLLLADGDVIQMDQLDSQV